MEILIGIRGNKNLLGFDVDMSENELMAKVNEALASDHGVLDLTDTKGQRTLVPAHALAYVQIAAKTSTSAAPANFSARAKAASPCCASPISKKTCTSVISTGLKSALEMLNVAMTRLSDCLTRTAKTMNNSLNAQKYWMS